MNTVREYIEKLRNAMISFNQRADYFDEEDINFRPDEFKFISLEGNICSIKEYKHPKHPYLQRYLYYYEDNKNNKANNISNGVNNEIRLISRPYRLKPIDPASLIKNFSFIFVA